MPQIKGLYISTDESAPIIPVIFERGDLDAMYSLLGCRMVDVVDMEAPPSSIWIDDEGKLTGKKVNSRATTLLWAFCKPWVGHDLLCGDVLITGQPDEEGETQDVPAELAHLLLEVKSFKVEVQTDGSDAWTSNEMTFADWFSAAGFVIDLGIRWSSVTATRIAARDE